MKFLVTGANGFVGGWLLKELTSKGHDVIAVIKDNQEDISRIVNLPKVSIVYCDLSNISELSKIISENVDVIYHLAWIAAGGLGRANYQIQLQNIRYACDMVTVAKDLSAKKILFAGTVSERIVDHILDMDAVATNNIYGISKVTTHRMVDVLCKKEKLDYVWMQFSNLYGPYSINGNIVGYAITEILHGREASFGPATQPYDLLYVEDLVNAMYLLGVNKTKSRIYYLGSGNVRLLSNYLKEIGKICGHPELIKIGARPDDGLRYQEEWFDNSPLKREFNFTPHISFREGILKTQDWLMDYLHL